MSNFDALKRRVDGLFRADPIEKHPLFFALEAGDFSTAEVRQLGLQIFHVVDCFPRFLAAILTNLTDHRLRMPLVENLYCEHGRMDPTLVHVQTYRTFLRSLGVDDAAIAASLPGIPVIAYNRAVLDLCLHHAAAEGLGALGVIEEIVARVSPIVSRYAARQLGLQPAERGHFADHEVLDVRHADEIYALAAELYQGASRGDVDQGLQLGMYYHRRLYSDLFAANRAAAAQDRELGAA
jgi:pyrroloquinoline quinone (PQQ) biosynthesis protein C